MKCNYRQIAYVLTVVLPFLPAQATLAFDDDKTISDIHLKNESFLDINAHQFRKSLDLLWLETVNGLRAAGGSISTDRAYLQTDVHLHRQLFNSLGFGFELEHETFYAPKPLPLPLIYVDVYPSTSYDAAFSFLGTPAHDKRQSDVGYAVTFGRRPMDYLRISWLKVDLFYNEKNEFDDSRYDEFGETIALNSVATFKNRWTLTVDLLKDRPLDFIFDNQSGRFTHHSHDYKVGTVYRLPGRRFAGIKLRDLSVDKSLLENAVSDSQSINYNNLDIYWVNQRFRNNKELTLGFRYDNFEEVLDNHTDPVQGFHFELTTWQLYSNLLSDYDVNQAWELGLYLGWSERSKTFNVSNTEEFDDKGIEAKLRTSWQYHSIDKNNVILFSLSFNLDDLIEDPSDGGGIYLQSQF